MFYKTKIKAGGVTNLTDARYFAAMAVHYLGINLDALEHPVAEFKEIVEWVEVDHIIAESERFSAEDWRSFQSFTEVDIFQTQEKIEGVQCIPRLSSFKNLPEDGLVIVEAALETFEAFCKKGKKHPNVLVSPMKDLKIENLLPHLELFHGIEIFGSEEERPGFKSYEDLDVFFELLEL